MATGVDFDEFWDLATGEVQWGVNDCCRTVGILAKAATGVDPMDDWVGRYTTKVGAFRLVKNRGFESLEKAIVASLEGAGYVPVKHPSDGDITIVRYEDASQGSFVTAPAIYADGNWLVRTDSGGMIVFDSDIEIEEIFSCQH